MELSTLIQWLIISSCLYLGSSIKQRQRNIRKRLHHKRELIYIPEVVELQKKARLGRRSRPAKSCRDIFREVPGAKSGVYWFEIIDKFNKTKQVQYYCKKGEYFEEPNGTYPPENLNAGKAKAEPYDWEELHRESWPSPIDPPDEETMDRKIKQALKERKKEQNGTKQTEIEMNKTATENREPITLKLDNMIKDDKTTKSGKIKIVRAKADKPGKRSGIDIKILNLRKIGTNFSKKLNKNATLAQNATSSTKKFSNDSKQIMPESTTKNSLRRVTVDQIGSRKTVLADNSLMDGTVVKELSAAVDSNGLEKTTLKGDTEDSEQQSSVIMEVNRKSIIGKVKDFNDNNGFKNILDTNRTADSVIHDKSDGVNYPSDVEKKEIASETKEKVANRNENSSDRKENMYDSNVTDQGNGGSNIVSEAYHTTEDKTEEGEHSYEVAHATSTAQEGVQPGLWRSLDNTTEYVPTAQKQVESNSVDTQNMPNTTSFPTSTSVVNEGVGNASTDVDQPQEHNWPAHINDVLNQLQINSSHDTNSVEHGEPLTFSPLTSVSKEDDSTSDDIQNSTWPNGVNGLIANAMRDWKAQKELAKQKGGAEEFFSQLLSGKHDNSSQTSNREQLNDLEDYAAAIIPSETEDNSTYVDIASPQNYNSTHALTIVESNSIWDTTEGVTVTSSDVNEALNSLPYASYKTRIRRQLDNM